MEELSEQQESKMETEGDVAETQDESTVSTDTAAHDVDSVERTNQRVEDQCPDKKLPLQVATETISPSKTNETVTGTKMKRKARSTRRKLNAMVNNASLHFSDTDSEGELSTIAPQARILRHTPDFQQGPIISVTLDEANGETGLNESLQILSPDSKETLNCNSFAEPLTDVDEIYASETENEQKDSPTSPSSLKVVESCCQDETEFEDIDDDEEVETTIYVKPRIDVFCEYSGETITTKEGDGPFSVEVRNKIYLEERPQNKLQSNTPDITVPSNTDEEEMTVSDEEDMQEACFSQREVLDDLDVLAASQIVMRNIHKTGKLLTVKVTSDDAINDCHTDIEEVEQTE